MFPGLLHYTQLKISHFVYFEQFIIKISNFAYFDQVIIKISHFAVFEQFTIKITRFVYFEQVIQAILSTKSPWEKPDV